MQPGFCHLSLQAQLRQEEEVLRPMLGRQRDKVQGDARIGPHSNNSDLPYIIIIIIIIFNNEMSVLTEQTPNGGQTLPSISGQRIYNKTWAGVQQSNKADAPRRLES